MGKSKMKKPKTNEEKQLIPRSRILKKKKRKSQELRLAKSVKAHNLTSSDPPSAVGLVQNNIRQSIFSCKVSDVLKTRVDSSFVNILQPDTVNVSNPSTAKVAPDNSAPCSQVTGEQNPNLFADFLHSVKFFVSSKNMVLALCEHPDVLNFFGVVKFSVLHGKAEVMGFVFNDRTPSSNVFSLKDSGLLQIIILKNAQCILDHRELKEKIEDKCPSISAQAVRSILTTMKPSSVLILLERSEDTRKMQSFLNSQCKSSIFPTAISIRERILANQHSDELMKVEQLLTCQFLHPLESEKFFNVSDQWQQLVNELPSSANNESGNIYLLAGGKGVGKSTLLRYLINQCLSRESSKKVLLIDLDPGQCELTLPGCLSVHVISKPLLGPNFSHLSHAGRVWFLGDLNVTQCFHRYLKYMEEVLSYCTSNAEFKNIPWFINTMGFCKGLGVELMSCTIHYFRPTHVVQIQSKKENNNYPLHLSSDIVKKYQRFINFNVSRIQGDVVHTLCVISSLSDVNPNATNPPERRGAVILAYFSQILPKSTSFLTDVTPLVTDAGKLEIIICHSKNFDRAQTLATINGNLVALCSKKSDIFEHKCLGFGIVRGIDFEDGRLYLLTPLEEELKEINCLMMGNILLPQSLYLQSHSSGHVPYVNIGEGQMTGRITRRTFKRPSTVSFQERFRNESRMERS